MSAHICPACGSRMRVVETGGWGEQTNRKLRCACGEGWESVETRMRRLPALTTPEQREAAVARYEQARAAVSTPGQGPPPVATGLPSSDGGVGGGLSSGSLSLVFSGPDQASSKPSDARAMRAARRAEETPAFAAFYELFPRKEKRPNAFAAWQTKGCEAFSDQVMAGLRRWLPEFASRPADKVPHPTSWLNGRQWQDDPPSHALPSKSVANVAALAEWQPPTKVFG